MSQYYTKHILGLMEKQDLDTGTDMDTDMDICACTMVGLDYWTYPYYLF